MMNLRAGDHGRTHKDIFWWGNEPEAGTGAPLSGLPVLKGLPLSDGNEARGVKTPKSPHQGLILPTRPYQDGLLERKAQIPQQSGPSKCLPARPNSGQPLDPANSMKTPLSPLSQELVGPGLSQVGGTQTEGLLCGPLLFLIHFHGFCFT